jgi:NAD(P)-dependent dehydrogenase (short-subunit alcohol dehydrogenase family)
MGSALVFGASGGIGAALVAGLLAGGGHERVVRLSRTNGDFDLTDEASIERAVARVTEGRPVTLCIIATGLLSEGERRPERSMRELDAEWMARNFAINAIGPALIAKHVIPHFPRDRRAVLTALSARVGSISDNRLGGWHSYRASKAALNMLIRTLALEVARSRPEAVVAGLHPGTVDTPLSKPFQGNVDAARLFDAERSARHLLDVIAGLTPAQSGHCFAWDGAEIPA